MCFYKTYQNPLAKKATQDMYAFKLLKKKNGELYSPVRNSKWGKLGKKRAIGFKSDVSGNQVYQGIHCYKGVNEAIKSRYTGVSIFLMKIPRGAWYYENDTQYCSSSAAIVCEMRIPKKVR
jgi:hypothetical protein